MNRHLLAPWFAGLALLGSGCDTATPNSDPDPDPDPPTQTTPSWTPAPSVRLTAGRHDVTVNMEGAIREGRWGESTTAADDDANTLYTSGLWVSGRREGALGASLMRYSRVSSNWTAPPSDDSSGVYLVSDSGNLPPGLTRLRGDEMAWSTLIGQPNTRFPELAQPIPDLTVSQEVFVYERADAADLLFVRYVLTNNGATLLSDAYAGFYADTDLEGAFGGSSAPGHSVFNNLTGFDRARGLSYTYHSGAALDPGAQPALVTGFAFLETPRNAPLMSHRIARKNNYVDPDFGEIGFERPEQVDWALRGRSITDQPMRDPATGEPSLFAFTGDPVTRTGWLDGYRRSDTGQWEGLDVRSLLSAGPFTLAPGESATMTVVHVTTEQATLRAALDALGQRLDAVRRSPGLWQ